MTSTYQATTQRPGPALLAWLDQHDTADLCDLGVLTHRSAVSALVADTATRSTVWTLTPTGHSGAWATTIDINNQRVSIVLAERPGQQSVDPYRRVLTLTVIVHQGPMGTKTIATGQGCLAWLFRDPDWSKPSVRGLVRTLAATVADQTSLEVTDDPSI